MRIVFPICVILFLNGCSTSMDRAQKICNQIGNPTPACYERQFNIERARDDALWQSRQQMRENQPAPYNVGAPQSATQPQIKSEYDIMVEQSERQARQNCAASGGVYENYGSGWTCGAPKALSLPPARPIRPLNPLPRVPKLQYID